MKLNLPTPASTLAIGAHPDDVEFDCGGSLAKWAAAGAVVHHLICTDGSKGTWDPNANQAELVALRQREQRNAAATLGATGEVVFLGWPDGELDSGLRQRSQVAYWIRKLRPDVVLAHDPWMRYRLHPDHRAAGFLAVDGVVVARDPFFFAEHDIAHHRPSALLLFEAEEPDHAEDVTGYGDVKVDALLQHRSQFVSTMEITDPDNEAQVAGFREREHVKLTAGGEQAGVTHAELFKALFP